MCPAPRPGIPCALSERLGSAAALRLHSRHGCLQQVPHRAPFRHRRRHGRRLRAALPAQQAAGRGPARVSWAGARRAEGRGRGRGRAAVVRGAEQDGTGPGGQAQGSPCRRARCLRPRDRTLWRRRHPLPLPVVHTPAPLLKLYLFSQFSRL